MDDQSVRDFQNAVYAFANAVGGFAEILGMQAAIIAWKEHQKRSATIELMPHGEADFKKIMEDRGLYHNSLMQQVYDR